VGDGDPAIETASGDVDVYVDAHRTIVVGWTLDPPSGEAGPSVRDASYFLFTATPPSRIGIISAHP